MRHARRKVKRVRPGLYRGTAEHGSTVEIERGDETGCWYVTRTLVEGSIIVTRHRTLREAKDGI